MSDPFQRLLIQPEPLSLNAQAAMGVVHQPKRSQFSLLVRHFLERFFNHETASADGDTKSRLILIAFAAGLPGFVVMMYLWPIYHPIRGWPPDHPSDGGPPPYWLQVNHHFFFVILSMVVMGIVTVFEWDMFFPDLLDIFVMKTLPIRNLVVFSARVVAIAILIGGFLFDANILSVIILPASLEPPILSRILAGHLCAVVGGGLFSALCIIAIQGILLSMLGERLFRKLSLLLQGLTITALLMLLFLFPTLSGAVPNFLQSENGYALYLPPFWFLGIYQRLLEGPSALLIYTRLSHTGTTALIVVFGLACLAYPFAYLRKIRQLVEGPGRDESRAWLTKPVNRVVHALLIQQPISRAVFHFIHQTIMRVQRYRIYLVLYGGVGLSVVLATILRITVVNQLILIESSADGIRSALGIVPFWMITGLSIAFISPGNQKGSWIFRIVHGRPVYFEAAIRLLRAQKFWVMLWTTLVTFAACALMCAMAPPELKGWPARSAIFLVAGGMCLLLTDLSFLNVKIIAFTGEPSRESSNLAFTVLKYFIFVPVIAWLPLVVEPWIEMSRQNFAIAVAAIAIVHLLLRYFHRSIIREHCNMIHPEEDEEDFPMKLGLKYL